MSAYQQPIEKKRTGDSVDLPGKLRVLEYEVDSVEVQLDQTVVHRRPVPILGNPLPALPVGQVALFTVDGEEIADNLLCCFAVR